MMQKKYSRGSAVRALGYAALIALLMTMIPTAPAAAETSRAEIGVGHVDIGPALIDDKLTILVKDDSSGSSVWRSSDDVSFRVHDSAAHPLPAGDEYRFLGDEGDEIYLIPQTQMSGLVWLGWNTQHPSMAELAPSRVTLNLQDLVGPGQLHVYFDYGGFRDPEVVWGDADSQPLEVELDTHAHANWAFSKPGTYEVSLVAEVETADGDVLTTSARLQFLVGDAASPPDEGEPFAADYSGFRVGVAITLVIAALGFALYFHRKKKL